jgi:hypothetical protein
MTAGRRKRGRGKREDADGKSVGMEGGREERKRRGGGRREREGEMSGVAESGILRRAGSREV